MTSFKTQAYIGAALGLVAFFAVAMLPAALYGGYAGVLMASGILGSPLQPSFLARTFIVGGMILGTIGVGALFTVGGAVAGSALAALTKTQEPALPVSARK